MREFIFLLAVFLLAATSAYAEEDAQSPKIEGDGTNAVRNGLLNTLFETYQKSNHPDNTTVKFGIAPLNIEFDVEHNIMKTDAWIRCAWQDDRLKWDKEVLGINVLRIPAHQLWLPDIMLYNGKNPEMECSQINALVYHNGEVLWVPPCRLESYCNLTLSQDPFAEQICKLKFGSWTFDGWTMGMEIYKNKTGADLEDYQDMNYSITKNEAVREEKTYPCCVEPYFNILYTLGITKKGGGVNCNN